MTKNHAPVGETDLPDVVFLDQGLVRGVVCSRLTDTDMESWNAFSGTTGGWNIAEHQDGVRVFGDTYPMPCNEFPEVRRHFLVEC